MSRVFIVSFISCISWAMLLMVISMPLIVRFMPLIVKSMLLIFVSTLSIVPNSDPQQARVVEVDGDVGSVEGVMLGHELQATGQSL